MGFADSYFAKQDSFKPFISSLPNKELTLSVVIPSYKEPELLYTLNSLATCKSITGKVEIIIVINSSDADSKVIIEKSRQTYAGIREWQKSYQSDRIIFYPILIENIPSKYAGVGYARKIGMDEALWRFNLINNKNGIIANFDADASCTKDYIKAVDEYFNEHLESPGASIYYEHEIEGKVYSPKVYQSIIKYELYLRYYILALRYAQFPWSYHTLGSSFAVRANEYMKQGGMNRRKAGEDFYFLHKIIPIGNYGEINNTCITLSPRPSDRVPFGTGATINRLLIGDDDEYYIYCFQAFIHLLEFSNMISEFYKVKQEDISRYLNNLPVSVRKYLIDSNVYVKIEEINSNCASIENFYKRFFTWISAFWVLKWLNSTHQEYYEKKPVRECVISLINKIYPEKSCINLSEKELLIELRKIEKRREIEYDGLFNKK